MLAILSVRLPQRASTAKLLQFQPVLLLGFASARNLPLPPSSWLVSAALAMLRGAFNAGLLRSKTPRGSIAKINVRLMLPRAPLPLPCLRLHQRPHHVRGRGICHRVSRSLLRHFSFRYGPCNIAPGCDSLTASQLEYTGSRLQQQGEMLQPPIWFIANELSIISGGCFPAKYLSNSCLAEAVSSAPKTRERSICPALLKRGTDRALQDPSGSAGSGRARQGAAARSSSRKDATAA